MNLHNQLAGQYVRVDSPHFLQPTGSQACSALVCFPSALRRVAPRPILHRNRSWPLRQGQVARINFSWLGLHRSWLGIPTRGLLRQGSALGRLWVPGRLSPVHGVTWVGRWLEVHQILPHPKGAGPDLQQTVLQMPLAHDAATQRVKPA